MAEIVVRGRCNDISRQTFESAIDLMFPLWGIVSPLMGVFSVCTGIAQLAQGDNIASSLGVTGVCLGFSVGCLYLRNRLAHDYFVINQQGFKLPRFMKARVAINLSCPWTSIESVSAAISQESPQNSTLFLTRSNGTVVTLSLSQFEPDFVEQLILAVKLWAPNQCNDSVTELQELLMASKSGLTLAGSGSFTQIWEEELGRRFNPTSYITLEAGKVLYKNSLRVVRQMASGGLSALYLCQQDDKRLVVLKESVIPEHVDDEIRAKAIELFDREAKILMRLDHPNVVKVLDTFVEAGRNYLILEYANGADLRQLVQQNGPQSEDEVIGWAIQIVTTLQYLHERELPVIHRDLTPDNIVLRNDGQIIVVDFGAANEVIGNATGTFVGKHSYIAPEQLRGKATTQSDIYAFGGTLHYLLTGQEPEALSSSRPKELSPKMSDTLSQFVEKCTEMETADRYQNVAELLAALTEISGGLENVCRS